MNSSLQSSAVLARNARRLSRVAALSPVNDVLQRNPSDTHRDTTVDELVLRGPWASLRQWAEADFFQSDQLALCAIREKLRLPAIMPGPA